LNASLVRDLRKLGLWNAAMVDQLKYFDGELKDIDGIPAHLKSKYLTAFGIDPKWVIDAAARRQKWIDQAQSVNLWLASNEMRDLSHMYRRAWHVGLKTTYYLRTLGASNIEKATVDTQQKPAATVDTPAVVARPDEKACSLEARMRGETCESCQ
jgi:ribonucleoside-diphosphate reductase alpha chain